MACANRCVIWTKVNGGNFSLVEYRDKKGELRPFYSLTKTECLYIATKFNDEARAKPTRCCATWASSIAAMAAGTCVTTSDFDPLAFSYALVTFDERHGVTGK